MALNHKPLSVSEINRKAKQLLETHFCMVWVIGELSTLSQPNSGHWYFSLKDNRCQIRCAMFKQANSKIKFIPKTGQKVIARGRISLYEGRGDYQLIVEHLSEEGIGNLHQQFEALKARLQQEGLFDSTQKRNSPPFPKRIAIITSPSGAALHDFLSVLKRRYPIAEVVLVPVTVQGDSAAQEMVQALKLAERFGQLDLIMIGRGGGSLEDLWAFNDETLARAIHACSIPIISAVGHEVDFTICDFVADLRAPTPSACAEIATPDINEWIQNLDAWQRGIKHTLIRKLVDQKRQVLNLSKQLKHPSSRLKMQGQSVESLYKTLSFVMEKNIKHKRSQLQNLCTLLNAINPLEVLSRGYSITTTGKDNLIISADTLSEGDSIETQFKHGRAQSTITKIMVD